MIMLCNSAVILIVIDPGCRFFAYNWKIPACSGAFLLTVDNFALLLTIGALLLTATLQF